MCRAKRSVITCARKPLPSSPLSITRTGPGAVSSFSWHTRQAYLVRAISCTSVTSMRSSCLLVSWPIAAIGTPQQVRSSSASS